jgi:peptide-methionine (S)-S-oxide reductase
MKAALSYFLLAIATLTSCAQNSSTATNLTNNNNNTTMDSTITPKGTEVATFANGCFWCTEAIFEELPRLIGDQQQEG